MKMMISAQTTLLSPRTRRSGWVRSIRPQMSRPSCTTTSGRMRPQKKSTTSVPLGWMPRSVYSSPTALDPGRAHPSGADSNSPRLPRGRDEGGASVASRPPIDPEASRAVLRVGDRSYRYNRLDAAAADLATLPYTVKVLLENALRHAAGRDGLVSADDVRALAAWDPSASGE